MTRRRLALASATLAGASAVLALLLVAAGVRSFWTRDWVDLGGQGRSYLTSERGAVALHLNHGVGVSGYRRATAPVTDAVRYVDVELRRAGSTGLARRLKFGHARGDPASTYNPGPRPPGVPAMFAWPLPVVPPGAPGWTLAVAPYWALALPPALLAAALWLVARRLRRASLAAVGRCPSCGYDLRASPDRCPECGAMPDPRRPDLAQTA